MADAMFGIDTSENYLDLLEALKQALLAISSHDSHTWFLHCGYAHQVIQNSL